MMHATAQTSVTTPTATPFANSNGTVPPIGYTGPIFALSHNYPTSLPNPPSMPWRAAINNGLITTANASVYAEALKQSIRTDMETMLQNPAAWNPSQAGWYNEPWLGYLPAPAGLPPNYNNNGREPTHGMYVGSNPLDKSLFAKSGLTKPITTYVLVYYNKTAAATLNNVWGSTAIAPTITAASTQFAEGSVIIKAAYVTADASVWPVMKGALTWSLYVSTNATANKPPYYLSANPVLTNTSLMQFDIIVKDSQSAPKTGWVFTTLVYDMRLPRKAGIWDQMVVLGAQWGNDPQAKNPGNLHPVLTENWNNPAAPAYSTETLGWGERMSGPNDGAMNDYAYSSGTNPTASEPKAGVGAGAPVYVKNGKDSSCMSCHSSAQWNTSNPSVGMESFLLPILSGPQPALPPGCTSEKSPCSQFLNSPPPGSPLWMQWFADRLGNQPMNAGSIAGDFDMALTFKTLPAWYAATTHTENQLLYRDLRGKKIVLKPEGQAESK
jgi:hypothetical protein